MNEKKYKIKEVKGFEGRYMVDTEGNIWSMYRYSNRWKTKISKPIILSPMLNTNGYKTVTLYDNHGHTSKKLVHRLVALAFLDNPYKKRCVCHKDNNRLNCKVSNLYWGTDSENRKQAYDDLLHKNAFPIAKLNLNGEILDVYKNQRYAEIKNNIPQPHISECLKGGRRKTTKGVKWKRITKEEYESFVTMNGVEIL